ncbi:MAG: hypothetical protein JWM41_4785 [Gemmatimonadetes bacterium]|nr:hypothetical protein [Gemmatimonadota bacterium]
MRPHRRLATLLAAFAVVAAALLALLTTPTGASAQTCDTTTTRTTYAGRGGVMPVIRSIAVRTDAPIALPIGGTWLSSLRRTTESHIVRRQLLFAPGERIDTLRIAETLRRLRDQRLYADVVLEVARCAGADSVDLTVATRDAWTLRPIARVVPPATVSLGVEDRNVLGTARSVSISNDQTERGHGGSVAITDPWLFGTNVIGGIRFSDVAGNHLLRASLRHHEISNFDPWRAEASLARQTFSDMRPREHALGTLYVAAQVGHTIGNSRMSITLPYVGAELDSAHVIAVRRGDLGIPGDHQRRFIGLDAGLLRRAAQFDTVSWFVPHRGFLDIPSGFEEDVMIAPGTDRAQHAAAARFDAWAGRMWIPRRGQLVTADLWSSGFVGNVRANQIDRVALSGYQEARGGFWGGRVMFEQLLQLDPDLRILSLATVANDPSFPAVPQPFRLADRVFTSSAERSVHLRPVGRSSSLDGALFAAASARWDAPTMGTDHFAVAIVGARLRLLAANGAISSTRVDVSYPVAASGSVVRRLLVSVSIAPLFDTARQRDGRRRQ